MPVLHIWIQLLIGSTVSFSYVWCQCFDYDPQLIFKTSKNEFKVKFCNNTFNEFYSCFCHERAKKCTATSKKDQTQNFWSVLHTVAGSEHNKPHVNYYRCGVPNFNQESNFECHQLANKGHETFKITLLCTDLEKVTISWSYNHKIITKFWKNISMVKPVTRTPSPTKVSTTTEVSMNNEDIKKAQDESDTPVIIGCSVAGVIILIIILLVVIFLWRRKTNRNRSFSETEEMPGRFLPWNVLKVKRRDQISGENNTSSLPDDNYDNAAYNNNASDVNTKTNTQENGCGDNNDYDYVSLQIKASRKHGRPLKTENMLRASEKDNAVKSQSDASKTYLKNNKSDPDSVPQAASASNVLSWNSVDTEAMKENCLYTPVDKFEALYTPVNKKKRKGKTTNSEHNEEVQDKRRSYLNALHVAPPLPDPYNSSRLSDNGKTVNS